MAWFLKLSTFLFILQTAFYVTNGLPTNPIITSKAVQMPSSCAGKTYCFDSEHYPIDAVQYLLKTSNFTAVSQSGPEIDHRIEDDEETDKYIDTGCKKNRHDSLIYYILDENNEVRVVVQSNEIYTQNTRVQECVDEKPSPSLAFAKEELENLNLRCENLMFNYKFFVLSTDFSSIEIVQNKGGLPGDCVCRA